MDKIFIKYIDCEINVLNDTPITTQLYGKREVIYTDGWDTIANIKTIIIINNHTRIENNKTYDLNDVRFIRRLDKYKHSIKLHYSDKLDYINDKYRPHFTKN